MRKKAENSENVIELDVIKVISAFIVILMCVLVIIGAVSYVRGLMTVGGFEIVGDSPYDREAIISATGIKYGEKLYSLDRRAIEEKIMQTCPYISEVKVSCKFPSTLKIKVDSISASWYVRIVDDYYALDGELRVLEETASNKRFKNLNIPELKLPNIKSAVVGSVVEFGADDAEIKYANELMKMINATAFKGRITFADISNRFEIYIEVDGKINAYMGGVDDFSSKLNAVQKVLDSPEAADCISAQIDASNPSQISFRPVYDSATTTDEAEKAED